MPPVNYRKNLRLPGYDYSLEGAYFITIVTQRRRNIFGWVVGGEMKLNDAGRMVDQVCREIPQFIPGIRLDCYQIMPDHVHMIVEIVGLSGNVGVGATVGATLCGCPGQTRRSVPTDDTANGTMVKRISLPNVVARFKSLTTRRYIDGVQLYGWPRFDKRLWQRNYYEHIIRNVQELQRIVEYIQANPLNWEK